MKLQEMSLAELLSNREIFAIFDEEFHRGSWLDVTALLKSEGNLEDLYRDGSVPSEVLDRIKERLSDLEKSTKA